RGGTRIGINPGVPPAFIARASGRPFRPVSVAPVVLVGTAGVAGAVILRENFRDPDRTRIQIRETNKFIQPNDRFVPLKPLQRGERGQLGGITPSAARGVGIETSTKVKSFQPQMGPATQQQQQQKTFQQQDQKALQDKSLQQKSLQDQQKFEQKKFEGRTQDQFRDQERKNLQQEQQKKIEEKRHEGKRDKKRQEQKHKKQNK